MPKFRFLAASLLSLSAWAPLPEPPSEAAGLSGGEEIGAVYEAWLSPEQEPDEEQNTPAGTPEQLRSHAPSVDRRLRKSRGYGQLRFARNLSRVEIEVTIENVRPQDINMFHIHCGRPDLLGPILIDFSHKGALPDLLSQGHLTTVLRDLDIDRVSHGQHDGPLGFTAGCPVLPGQPAGTVRTIAGMEWLARHSELYFNLHTQGQTFFGEMRGQIHPVISPAGTAGDAPGG